MRYDGVRRWIGPLALLVPALGVAQPVSIGPELQVNTYTFQFQFIPAVATDGSGNFVVVWQSDGSSGTDTGSSSIQGQRYDTSGNALGGEFQVNTFTTANQFHPAVAADVAGNFVVVWTSVGSVGSDGSSTSIQGQRYSSTGAPAGGQFQVNSYATGAQSHAAVAYDAGGNFFIVWASDGSVGSDADLSIQGQRYDAAGTPLGAQIEVNEHLPGIQDEPVIAGDGLGNAIVVWQSFGSAGSDSGGSSVQAKRYAAGGATLTPQFQVNTYTTNNQFLPGVSADSAGNFVVVWASYGSVGTDTFNSSIQGQRYDSMGTPQGGQFQVNTFTTGDQKYAGVATDDGDDFVVVWTSQPGPGPDLSATSIHGQRYDSSGAPDAGQFQVNTYVTSSQQRPVIAPTTMRGFVVAWDGDGSGGTDDSVLSVHAQLFEVPTTTSSSSTSTTTTLPPTDLLPGRVAVIKPSSLAKFVAKPLAGGGFVLPSANPVTAGGTLRLFDTAATAGDVSYALPATAPPLGWKGLGNPAGSKGYKYKGAGTLTDPCRVVLVKENVIKGVCKGAGVTLMPPFTGDVGIILSLGTTDRYCARFGGGDVKNDAALTKRTNAPAPAACP